MSPSGRRTPSEPLTRASGAPLSSFQGPVASEAWRWPPAFAFPVRVTLPLARCLLRTTSPLCSCVCVRSGLTCRRVNDPPRPQGVRPHSSATASFCVLSLRFAGAI
ncbi:hypothetical protein MRX96_014637 [Rhipicephalus microplus]